MISLPTQFTQTIMGVHKEAGRAWTGMEWQRELTAIRAFAGRGMVQLLDADEEKGIMYLERAMQWYKKLLSTQKEQCLLHGDLHHENILRAEREPWLAIDPNALSLQKERVLAWAYCHSVLSAWWFIEDFGNE
ncbi:aminoglycoside phosphotransferase family protein [Brevibacillus porteri]